jgi:hypothetical protein
MCQQKVVDSTVTLQLVSAKHVQPSAISDSNVLYQGVGITLCLCVCGGEGGGLYLASSCCSACLQAPLNSIGIVVGAVAATPLQRPQDVHREHFRHWLCLVADQQLV